MCNFELLFKQKAISRTDWMAAKVYKKLRYLVLRSKAVEDSLHCSSVLKLGSVKGIVSDSLSSKTLEQFWKGIEHYFKEDSLPVITVLDSITGFYYQDMDISKEMTKRILKKFKKLLKNVDIVHVFERIDDDLVKSSFAA